MKWSGAVRIDPVGVSLTSEVAVGYGRTLVMGIAKGDEPFTNAVVGLARVDVTSGAVSPVAGDVDSPRVCPSGGTFLVGSGAVDAVDATTGGPLVSAGSPHVSVVDGDELGTAPVDTAVTVGAGGLVTSEGCAEGGMIATHDDAPAEDTGAVIVAADPGCRHPRVRTSAGNAPGACVSCRSSRGSGCRG